MSPEDTGASPWQPTVTATFLLFVAAVVALAAGLRLAGLVYWPLYLLLAAACLLAAFGTGRWLQFHLKSRPRLRSTLQGLWVSIFTLLFLFLALEAIFRVFVARPDGLAITLAHRNWMKQHWQPVNSLGYRDDEWTPQALAGRTKVLLVGDSFASGVGIDDYHQRMGNVLGSLLGNRYAVMLAAQPGWNTGDELEALKTYPYPPDVAVLVYYINDIDPAAARHGLRPDNPVPAAHSPFFPLIGTSYLLNFVYFQALRLPFLHASDTTLAYLEAAYQTPAIWQDHRQELLAVYGWAEAHHARLMVVIFPSLLKPQDTAFATHQVATVFSSLPVAVVDLAPQVIGTDPRDITVNPVDPHPNEVMHRRAAIAMCQAIATMSGLPPVSCPQSP